MIRRPRHEIIQILRERAEIIFLGPRSRRPHILPDVLLVLDVMPRRRVWVSAKARPDHSVGARDRRFERIFAYLLIGNDLLDLHVGLIGGGVDRAVAVAMS